MRSRNVPALGEALSRLLARLPPDHRQRIVRQLGLEGEGREGAENEEEDDGVEGEGEEATGGLVTNALGELEGGEEVSSRRVETRLQQLLLLGLDQRIAARGQGQGQGQGQG